MQRKYKEIVDGTQQGEGAQKEKFADVPFEAMTKDVRPYTPYTNPHLYLPAIIASPSSTRGVKRQFLRQSPISDDTHRSYPWRRESAGRRLARHSNSSIHSFFNIRIAIANTDVLLLHPMGGSGEPWDLCALILYSSIGLSYFCMILWIIA